MLTPQTLVEWQQRTVSAYRRVLTRLLERLGPPRATAFDCPACKTEGTFLVQFARGGLCHCVECGHHLGIGQLLDPVDEQREAEVEELQQAMTARAGPAGGAGPLR